MKEPIPSYIVNAKVVGEPINYKWNSDLGLKFYAAKDQNVKLYQAIDKSSFKGKFAIGIAISEWIFYRFEGHIQLTDAWNRVDAAWACDIHPLYAKDLRFELTPSVHETGAPIEGPVEIALSTLGKIYARYSKGNIYVAEPIVRQAVLARHLISDKKTFDDWLSGAIHRAVEVFPRIVEYDKNTKTYDASHEDPVPREFFEPGFTYTPETAKTTLREFLKTLDYTKNPYLRSPEEMKALGFQGTPYVL